MAIYNYNHFTGPYQDLTPDQINYDTDIDWSDFNNDNVK